MSSVWEVAIDPMEPRRAYAGTTYGVFAIENILSACAGDCNDSGAITIDELVTMVNIALSNTAASECLDGDDNEDGAITVEEVVGAVNSALGECS